MNRKASTYCKPMIVSYVSDIPLLHIKLVVSPFVRSLFVDAYL